MSWPKPGSGWPVVVAPTPTPEPQAPVLIKRIDFTSLATGLLDGVTEIDGVAVTVTTDDAAGFGVTNGSGMRPSLNKYGRLRFLFSSIEALALRAFAAGDRLGVCVQWDSASASPSSGSSYVGATINNATASKNAAVFTGKNGASNRQVYHYDGATSQGVIWSTVASQRSAALYTSIAGFSCEAFSSTAALDGLAPIYASTPAEIRDASTYTDATTPLWAATTLTNWIDLWVQRATGETAPMWVEAVEFWIFPGTDYSA